MKFGLNIYRPGNPPLYHRYVSADHFDTAVDEAKKIIISYGDATIWGELNLLNSPGYVYCRRISYYEAVAA